jgi:hypothetical protein
LIKQIPENKSKFLHGLYPICRLFVVTLLLENIKQQNKQQSYGTIKRTYPLASKEYIVGADKPVP